MEKIKIFLSDPQVLFREGIHFTLSGEEDFEVAGETTNNEDAYSYIESSPPNIAILNMKNGKLSGPEVTCRIKRNFPSVAVMLIADTDDEELLFAAIRCGASACFNKDTDPEYLLDVLRVVAQGGQPLTETLFMPEMAGRVLAEFKKLSPLSEQLNNLLARLSPKEIEVLNCIADGNNIEQVVTKLNTNEANIRRHLRLIVNKLVANDQAQAVIEAAQRGFPSLITSAALSAQTPMGDYVTRDEFNEFKESLTERLKSFIGELT